MPVSRGTLLLSKHRLLSGGTVIPSIRQTGLCPIRQVLQLPRRRPPLNHAIESLRGDIDSRPQTPTVITLDKDEREEFLKRENELSNQLEKKVL